MSDPLPKAALYYWPHSIWSSVALLALEEKGYGADEIDLKTVDLSKGQNYQPSYLRLNPNATVPTLVVPLENTLAPDIESRYKALQDTKSIVEFLDKSRSTQSRTHTTSSAPSPALSPATIAFSAASDKLIALLHSPAADPNALTILNARSNDALRTLAAARLPMLSACATALDALLADNAAAKIRVSDKTRVFWEAKRAAADGFLQVFRDAESPDGELGEDARRRRTEYFAAARKAWAGLADVLLQLNAEIIGPYVLGDQLSLADLHLAAWLARLAHLAGASAADDGARATALLEAHAGTGLALPRDFAVAEARRRAGLPLLEGVPDAVQSRLAAFWDAVRERASWKRVYADGLH
ncbi:hypothetical protein AcV7_000667 [Taiwanofungus camphoratus]|nr:hypothetical protein AcV7_000667 [Antrodia cinnamomea]